MSESGIAFHGTHGGAVAGIREHGLQPLDDGMVYVCPIKADARFYAAWQAVLQPLRDGRTIAWPAIAAVVEVHVDPDALEPDPEDPARQRRHHGPIGPERIVSVSRRSLPSVKAAERFARPRKGAARGTGRAVVCTCRRPARVLRPQDPWDTCLVCRRPLDRPL